MAKWPLLAACLAGGVAVCCTPGSARSPNGGANQGATLNRPVGGTFQGIWRGEAPFDSMTLASVGRDSLAGIVPDRGIRIRGIIRGERADISLVGMPCCPTGYLYLIPRTDSLVVGLRDSTGQWASFASLCRSASETKGGTQR